MTSHPSRSNAENHHHPAPSEGHHSRKHGGGLRSALHLTGSDHSHGTAGVYTTHELGIRAVKLSLLLLGVTTLLQAFVVVASGSVALLADTLHNLGDALNSIPLWIAFVLARRKTNVRYTYGYGRAEDLAGLVIVLSIAISAVVIFRQAFDRLLNPSPIENLAWVGLAALIGFLGNEAVAQLQIRTGRQIESAALIADGRHARIDGLTSLAVLGAVAATLLGYPILDPIIGIGIGLIVVLVARVAARSIWYRLMDAVDPELTRRTSALIAGHESVEQILDLRMRWIGHHLSVEAEVAMEKSLAMEEIETVSAEIQSLLETEISAVEHVLIAPRLSRI